MNLEFLGIRSSWSGLQKMDVSVFRCSINCFTNLGHQFFYCAYVANVRVDALPAECPLKAALKGPLKAVIRPLHRGVVHGGRLAELLMRITEFSGNAEFFFGRHLIRPFKGRNTAASADQLVVMRNYGIFRERRNFFRPPLRGAIHTEAPLAAASGCCRGC